MKYEYAVRQYNTANPYALEAGINAMTDYGWRLVFYVPDYSCARCVFERYTACTTEVTIKGQTSSGKSSNTTARTSPAPAKPAGAPSSAPFTTTAPPAPASTSAKAGSSATPAKPKATRSSSSASRKD